MCVCSNKKLKRACPYIYLVSRNKFQNNKNTKKKNKCLKFIAIYISREKE